MECNLVHSSLKALLLWKIAHKRGAALSLIKNLYSVCQCDCENVRARQDLSFKFCSILDEFNVDEGDPNIYRGSRDGVAVRALTSHQCGPGSIPGLGVICGLSLLLVLFSAPRGFSPGTPVFPSPQTQHFPNFNSILWIQCTIRAKTWMSTVKTQLKPDYRKLHRERWAGV